MKTTIQNITIQNQKAVVEYNTGTIREYPIDKLPKTVQNWMAENQTEETQNTVQEEKQEIMILPQIPAAVKNEIAQEQEVRIASYRMIPVMLLLIAASITRQLASICYMISDIIETAGQIRKKVKDIYMIYRYPVYEYIQYIRMQAQDSWAWREEIIRENRGAEE